MLQVFEYNKISRWLTKPAWQIEDLLTSVFFGSCEYSGIEAWDKILYPVFSTARYKGLINESKLNYLPRDVVEIEYLFWHNLNELDYNEIKVNKSEPEVILVLTTQSNKKFIIMVEVAFFK